MAEQNRIELGKRQLLLVHRSGWGLWRTLESAGWRSSFPSWGWRRSGATSAWGTPGLPACGALPGAGDSDADLPGRRQLFGLRADMNKPAHEQGEAQERQSRGHAIERQQLRRRRRHVGRDGGQHLHGFRLRPRNPHRPARRRLPAPWGRWRGLNGVGWWQANDILFCSWVWGLQETIKILLPHIHTTNTDARGHTDLLFTLRHKNTQIHSHACAITWVDPQP